MIGRRRGPWHWAGVWCAVLALHVLLAWLLARPLPAGRSTTAAQPPLRVQLRLVPKPEPRREAAPELAGTPARRPERGLATHKVAVPEAINLPRAPHIVVQSNEAPAPPAAAASEPEPALDLRLPQTAKGIADAHNPALDDPRANTTRPSLGERMARTLGTDRQVTEELRGNGRRRIRQGATCLDVRPSRAAEIDPIGQSDRPKPALVGAC